MLGRLPDLVTVGNVLQLSFQESVAAFEDLRAAVEETILEFLRRGQTSRDHKGQGQRVEGKPVILLQEEG